MTASDTAAAAGSPLSIRIAEFVSGIRYDALPPSTVAAVKRLMLDTIGCALGALDAQPAALLETTLPGLAENAPGARVFGSGRRCTAEAAAMMNGVYTRYLDFMDVYWSRDVCHPSENIPVALACVEEAKGSGIDLIEAIVTGYEVQIRLCDAYSFQDRGFHHVSAAGFVAPFVAGKAWRLPVHSLAHGSVLGGIRHLTLGVLSKGKLSMAKAVGYPLNASESIGAARLAGIGFTGPLAAYEWLFEKTAGAADPVDALALDHDAYRIERVSTKQYPVQYALQAPVAAAIGLHEQVRRRLNEITGIRASVKTETLARAADPDKYHPANRETADHSLPSCVAMALCDGVLNEAQFESARFADADVMRLTALVEAVGAPDFDTRFSDGRPGAVDVFFSDGTHATATEEVPLGDRTRPMTQADIEAKFLVLACPAVGEENARRIIQFIGTLETQASIEPLLDYCCRPDGR